MQKESDMFGQKAMLSKYSEYMSENKDLSYPDASTVTVTVNEKSFVNDSEKESQKELDDWEDVVGGALYQFEYCVSYAFLLAKAQGGTCTLAEADPPETVVHRATYLLENGFGCYNIFKNNCEDFAIYCKTGLLVIDRNPIGRSGQAASILGAPFAAIFSSPLRFLTTDITGMTVVAVGMYCLSRYAADIGVRRDVSKIAVDDLVVKLGVNAQVIPTTGTVQLL